MHAKFRPFGKPAFFGELWFFVIFECRTSGKRFRLTSHNSDTKLMQRKFSPAKLLGILLAILFGCGDDDGTKDTDGGGEGATSAGVNSASTSAGGSSEGATGGETSSSAEPRDTDDPTGSDVSEGEADNGLCDGIHAWAESCELNSDARAFAAECDLCAEIAARIGGGCLEAMEEAIGCVFTIECSAYDGETSCVNERAAAQQACT